MISSQILNGNVSRDISQSFIMMRNLYKVRYIERSEIIIIGLIIVGFLCTLPVAAIIGAIKGTIDGVREVKQQYQQKQINKAIQQGIIKSKSVKLSPDISEYEFEDFYHDLSEMSGHEFEYFCADLLWKNGFENVQVTPGSGDQGVDIIATKLGIKYAIQCKNYSSRLGNTPVQEIAAGKNFYHCHVGVVMTNSTFTKGARDLAEANNVLLWDYDELEKMHERT